jgi:hypothetical protein
MFQDMMRTSVPRGRRAALGEFSGRGAQCEEEGM